VNWYFEVLKKYVEFNGRARRAEYWYFVLFNIIISGILIFVDMKTGSYDPQAGLGLISGIYTLAVMLPSIAVAIRRLHDTGRSGWWFLIMLVPIIGPFVFIYFAVLDSQAGSNQYGPNPKDE